MINSDGWEYTQGLGYADAWHKVFQHGMMHDDTVSATIKRIKDDSGEWIWELSAYYSGHYRSGDSVFMTRAPHHLPRYQAIQLEALMVLAEQKWGVAESAPLPEGVEVA